MKTLPFNIGIATLLTALPLIAQASSGYCGDRVCHSYGSDGACNNYTCFGDGYGTGFSRNYDRYYNDDYYFGARNPYTGNCRYAGTSYRNYSGTYNYNNYGCRSEYTTTRPYDRTRSSRSSYYYDDYYYPQYDDRVYVPKAGYYYRY
ncbi:hypothetical protein KJ652_00920 [Patescibacteria group bacterium]|nr:hypothetical protein [Patescibacteria group bacterium]MBU1123132.1 hypothetical protein [Patescibacteria group bacterium]